MFTNKHILLITLILSLPAIIIGMEDNEFDYTDAIDKIIVGRSKEREMGRLIRKQTNLITQCAKKNANNIDTCDLEDIRLLAVWVNQQRNKLDDSDWRYLRDEFYKKIDYENRSAIEVDIMGRISNMFSKYTAPLIPGDDCTESLVDAAEIMVKRTQREYYLQSFNPVFEQQADNVINFVRNHEKNEQCMLNLGTWLANARTAITDTEMWNTLMNQLRTAMFKKIDKCDYIEYRRALDVVQIVLETAHELQPNENCLTQLIQKSTSAVEEVNRLLPVDKELLELDARLWNKSVAKNT